MNKKRQKYPIDFSGRAGKHVSNQTDAIYQEATPKGFIYVLYANFKKLLSFFAKLLGFGSSSSAYDLMSVSELDASSEAKTDFRNSSELDTDTALKANMEQYISGLKSRFGPGYFQLNNDEDSFLLFALKALHNDNIYSAEEKDALLEKLFNDLNSEMNDPVFDFRSRKGLSESIWDYPDSKGDTPLILAARFGFLKIVEALIMKEVNIDVRNKTGSSAIMEASSEEHSDIVKCLLSNNEDASLTNFVDTTADDPSNSEDIKEMSRPSVDVKEEPQGQKSSPFVEQPKYIPNEKDFEKPLDYVVDCISRGNQSEACKIIDQNKHNNVFIDDLTKYSFKLTKTGCLQIALETRQFEVADKLISIGADVNYIDREGKPDESTVLMQLLKYIREGNNDPLLMSMVEKVIDRGDVKYIDRNDNTVLMQLLTLIRGGKNVQFLKSMVEKVIAQGVDVEHENRFNERVDQIDGYRGSPDAIKSLIQSEIARKSIRPK